MLYAKSEPKQSIKEHTDALLSRLKDIKRLYGEIILKNKQIDKNRFWFILELACKYHDTGKVFTAFQNIILKKLNEKTIPTKFSYNIKHEQLSPMFIPIKELGLSYEYINLLNQIIYYHHERDKLYVNEDEIKDIINVDIMPRINLIEKELGIAIRKDPNTFYLSKVRERQRINSYSKMYVEYFLLKGLLHRLDHSASAEIKVEDDTNKVLSEYTERYVKNKFKKLNDLQRFCLDNQENNLVVIGSTGIGKTEAALLWSKNSKTFFTLPIRISINAIFDRIHDLIDYEHVGLLHSASIEYLEQKSENEEIELPYKLYEESKNLSSKITVCTINQIFTFVFKYRGYEKMYATLSYSKIIIDEIQAYSPRVVAVILKGLKMINEIGGKFMIMTATLPRIYKDYLKENGISLCENKFLRNDIKRHKIKFMENDIIDDVELIKKKSKNSKVLIIVNTINKALEIYLKLKNTEGENIKLLHSRFIAEDKENLEKEIKEFSKSNNNGIWITTQIVEASLDIDFDYLFTEMSTLDSLFQRMGRCYRSRDYEKNEPNIYIYTINVSGIGKNSVYDKDIHGKSIELLLDYIKNSGDEFLSEGAKVDLVDKLYSKEMLTNTNFLDEYEDSINQLESIIDYDNNKAEAQKILSEIETIKVIPKVLYEKNLSLFENYNNSVVNKEKNEIKRNIKKDIDRLVINVRPQQVKGFYYSVGYYIDDIFYVDKNYDENIGLFFKNDPEYNFNERNL